MCEHQTQLNHQLLLGAVAALSAAGYVLIHVLGVTVRAPRAAWFSLLSAFAWARSSVLPPHGMQARIFSLAAAGFAALAAVSLLP